jgi:hypothetical protein
MKPPATCVSQTDVYSTEPPSGWEQITRIQPLQWKESNGKSNPMWSGPSIRAQWHAWHMRRSGNGQSMQWMSEELTEFQKMWHFLSTYVHTFIWTQKSTRRHSRYVYYSINASSGLSSIQPCLFSSWNVSDKSRVGHATSRWAFSTKGHIIEAFG